MSREERALKIAELEGASNCVKLSPLERRFIKYDDYIMPDDYNKLHYSSFNGLMPIVEKVNKIIGNGEKFIIDDDDVTVDIYDYYKDFEITYFGGLIDALQEAIIWYHENKENGE